MATRAGIFDRELAPNGVFDPALDPAGIFAEDFVAADVALDEEGEWIQTIQPA